MFSLILGAVDISQIIGACVLVISVLSWFVNVIQGNTPDGTPRPKPPKAKPQDGRSEIEVLLQQLTGEKSKPKPERRDPPKPAKPQPPSDRRRSGSKPPASRPGSTSGPGNSRPLPRVAETHLAASNLGNDVRSHQMGNRVEAIVQQDIAGAVQRDIQFAVQHDLGNRIAAASPAKEKTEHPLVKVLRDPNGVRQAILLNEILQRPKSLRH